MKSVNNGRGWTLLEDFPHDNIVRGLFNPVLEVINEEKSHDDVIAKKIGFTTDNAPSYDWDRRYSVDFPLSGKESTEQQSICNYYALDEVYYNDALAYFKGRLTLYVGNVTS